MTTNWTPGIIFLVVGLLTGGLFLLLNRKKGSGGSAQAQDLRGKDLELRAQQLIEELKELEQNRHQLDPAQLAAERSRLEQEAAAAFRARDEHRKVAASEPLPASPRSSPAAARPAPTGFLAQNPALKGALWGGGVVLFFAALAGYLFVDAKERGENDSMTGGAPSSLVAPPSSGATLPSDEEARFQEALQQVRKSTQDIELVAAVAHELLRRQQWEEATKFTGRALSQDAFHTEHRIHRAVLHAVTGNHGKAIDELRMLANTYPDAHEALLFAGAIAIEQNDKATALAVFEQYAAEAPQDLIPAELLATVSELRRELGHP